MSSTLPVPPVMSLLPPVRPMMYLVIPPATPATKYVILYGPQCTNYGRVS